MTESPGPSPGFFNCVRRLSHRCSMVRLRQMHMHMHMHTPARARVPVPVPVPVRAVRNGDPCLAALLM